MCSYNNILTQRKHQYHARSQKSGSKLLATTAPLPRIFCISKPIVFYLCYSTYQSMARMVFITEYKIFEYG